MNTATTTNHRMAGFDDLRLAVIALVVLIHANVTYSGIGSWYYVERPSSSLDLFSLVTFATVGIFLQAWFMGVLFFVAGLMSGPSLDRKGKSAFIRDRAFRLLGPFFLYVLVINPLMILAFHPQWFPRSLASLISGSGPLWFTGALFVFSLVWAPIPKRTAKGQGPAAKLGLWFAAALVVGLAAWAIRIVFPVGTAQFNFQLCYFASYIVLFAAGTWLGRAGRFEALPASWARLAWITPLVSIPVVLVFLVWSGSVSGDRSLFGRGSWNSLGYAVWEGFTAIFMSLGLAVRAREQSRKAASTGAPRWWRFLRGHGFAVYVLHAPILWGLTLAGAGWAAPSLVKAPVMAVSTILVTLGVAALAKRIPGLRLLLA